MERTLESVFIPRSMGVIGASEVPGKASERRTRSLLEADKIQLRQPKN